MRRFRLCVGLALGTVLIVTTTAAAYICHPDLRGTRTLVVHGSVAGYALDGAVVDFAFRDRHGCGHRLVWQPRLDGKTHVARASAEACALGAAAAQLGAAVVMTQNRDAILRARDGLRRVEFRADAQVFRFYAGREKVRQFTRDRSGEVQKIALSGDALVALVRPAPGVDAPSRLEVYSVAAGRLLRAWPTLRRPATLDVQGDVALYAAAGRGGLFAVRLSDGRSTFVSPVQARDTPQINQHGVVYQSNLYERFNRKHKVFMKFVPNAALERSFTRTFDTLRTRWPIVSFSMDGPRVAVAVNAPNGLCDQVRFWNIPWHYVSRIAMRKDLSCARGFGRDIRGLALAGIGAEWVGVKGGSVRLITSDSKSCIERVIATAGSLRGITLAGDHRLLAYAVPDVASGEQRVSLVRWDSGHQTSVALSGIVTALAVDGGRLAALGADGDVRILSASGYLMRTLPAVDPRAIALRRESAVLLTGSDRLEVWSTRTARREYVWHIPRGAAPEVDVHFGIAVYVVGKTVYATRISSGRTVALATAPRRVRVQIEAPGVVYQSASGGGGLLRFIPLAEVERKLARA